MDHRVRVSLMLFGSLVFVVTLSLAAAPPATGWSGVRAAHPERFGGRGVEEETGDKPAKPPTGGTNAAEGKDACEPDLDSCSREGCAAGTEDVDEALFNSLKRTTTSTDGQKIAFASATPLSFDDLAHLQQLAYAEVGDEKASLTAAGRAALKDLALDERKVGEGTAVVLAGYLPDDPTDAAHYNTGESVNCKLAGMANNDLHITVVPGLHDPPCAGVVVEMIPQGRPTGWSGEALHRISAAGRKILVVGRLFYDNEHVVNPDCGHLQAGQPKRMTIWEIHPVIEFYVCGDDASACSATSLDHWTPLPTG